MTNEEYEEHRKAMAHVLVCPICIAELAKIESFIQHSKAGMVKTEKKMRSIREVGSKYGGRPEMHDPSCERRIAKEEARRNPAIAKHHYISVACTCGKGAARTWREKHGTEKD